MQINVGSLTGSTPEFLLLHLEPITRRNWPHLCVTDDITQVYIHTICEMTNYGLIIEVLCIV
jgi:hypothetical protein